mgnify:CR=1 FL=1
MKKLLFLVLILFLTSCEQEPDLTVTGTIKGLKKGTLYLQKLQDTMMIAVDSLEVNGEAIFSLQSELEEPEVMVLKLDDNTTDEYRITFFADKGITEINTTLKLFAYDAKIMGSDQQRRYEEFKDVERQFDNKDLDLLQERFDADLDGDTIKVSEIIKKSEGNLKRKYLYAVNFAMNNKDSEVAPYIALSEIPNINIKYLDTIYNALPEKIANSKYGVELKTFIKERKEIEKND